MRLFLLLLICPILIFSQSVEISGRPSWVKPVSADLDKENADALGSSIVYQLLDYQENVQTEEEYSHVVFKILNEQGVQSYSNIQVSYDPSYQSLVFHEIKLIRGNQETNKLKLDAITTIQRENDMSRNLYDGSLTSYLNLEDVRTGDIIEYSYTLRGYNPLMDGEFATSYYQDYSIPVNELYLRIVSDEELNISTINQAVVPKRSGNEYAALLEPSFIEYEPNTPNWYIPFRLIHFSTFEDWKDVSDWASNLYRINEAEKEKLFAAFKKQIKLSGKSEEDIISAIRFVQDEIRYLGFESGIQGYKPTDPQIVLDRRFGDCKDKSFLLSTILQQLGVEAYPMLVNTYKGHTIEDISPSPYAFDHCVVALRSQDSWRYIDPTSSFQGGSIDNISFPNYKRGLVLGDFSDGLVRLDDSYIRKQIVNETITVQSVAVDATATMDVVTYYYASSADWIRNYFSSTPRSTITREYTNYYSNLYPSIEALQEVSIQDSLRDSENIVVIKEQYKIENFWTEKGESGLIAESYPMIIESFLAQKTPAKREMPYIIGGPFDVQENIKLIMPEPWNVTASSKKVAGNGFDYESYSEGDGNIVQVHYTFKSDRNYVWPDAAADFLTKREEIQNDLSFNLTYNSNAANSDTASTNWLVVLVTLAALTVSCFALLKVYQNYNPEPIAFGKEITSIGGWLILLSISLVLSPIRMLYDMSDFLQYLDLSTWESVKYAYPDNYDALFGLILVEIFFNLSFVLFSILILVMFFSRRTAAPKLIIIFLISNILFRVVDSVIAGRIFEQNMLEDSLPEIARSIVFAVIWIAYLNRSERVANTFTKQIDNSLSIETVPLNQDSDIGKSF